MKYLALISIILGLAALGSVTKADDVTPSAFQASDLDSDEILVNGYLSDVPSEVGPMENFLLKVGGLLSNSCKRPGQTAVYFDQASKTFAIEQMIHTSGRACLQRTMPFSIAVNLGRLQPGQYKVQLGQGYQRGQVFTVRPSTIESSLE